MKQANNTDKQNVAEPVERRVSTEGNSSTQPEAGSRYLAGSEGKLARIRAIAREDKGLKFVNLLHHVSKPLLYRAYQSLKKKAAAGVDGETWASYGKTLEANISNLHKNVQDGRYKAKAVLRKWIDKPDGTKRPLGITCVEDKILQQAMVWVLESIYEQDFLGFSYGFRPKRNQHKALDALYVAITQKRVSYVLDADIKGFFDQIDQQQLMQFIQHRIRQIMFDSVYIEVRGNNPDTDIFHLAEQFRDRYKGSRICTQIDYGLKEDERNITVSYTADHEHCFW